ncbi:hypothetical protein CEUSTIGMA_g4468.t1 [Chlamydomonas eustigma]|uniref:PCI domain-containing protein n=1 Tax=Chlamydomonas eustigma TaxID=1157962 RepID=A0A250X1R7_9CHLO|nr:hypothetical protein CEUSTIGMA_g4468.t1 [Chlamydomonas eustigma]|eukprot:GAX77021.1 hypothetical protein CEUSTIGMA_g4468.t1 [Chlamydomonas eustigma]
MDEESKLHQFVLLAKGIRGRGLVDLILKATSDPIIFSYGELLDVPSVSDLANGELSSHLALLKIFAFGTWPMFKAQSSSLPEVSTQQALKLKQLTVVSLATSSKILPYATLMQQLDIQTVRELEDFIISECFYKGLVKGRLDQRQRCLQVHDVIGRDVPVDQLGDIEQSLGTWLSDCENVLRGIEQRIHYSTLAGEASKRHQADFDAKLDEAKKSVKTELELTMREGGGFLGLDEDGDYMDEDRLDRPMTGMGGSGTSRGGAGAAPAGGRPKSRRR